METRKKKLVLCIDSKPRTKIWADVAIRSILKHKPDSVDVYVVSDNPYRSSDIIWIDANPYIKKYRLDRISQCKYRKGEDASPMILFRIVLPLVNEFKDDEKIVYIDCDTEVIDKRFFSIFEERLNGCEIGAVMDAPYVKWWRFFDNKEICSAMCKSSRERLLTGGYVNSGVMLISPKQIETNHPRYEQEISPLIDMSIRNSLFWDQDLINIYFSIAIISDSYNVSPERNTFVKDKFLIHYTGWCKMQDQYPPVKERESFICTTKRESETEIEWDKWFDKVYCLHFLPYKSHLPRLIYELKRLNLWGNPILEIRNMVPQKMEQIVLMCSQKVIGGCKRLFEVGLGMENIRVMKEALMLGYERIMIIEDDAAFLRDKKEIVKILDSMPSGFGIIQMDKSIYGNRLKEYQKMLKQNNINEYYVDSSRLPLALSTCNVYTREGMKKCVDEMERRMGIIDVICNYIENEPALAIKNLAVQIIYGSCHNKDFYKKLDQLHSVYKTYGIDYSDYSVPNGYGYGKVVEE